MAVVLPQVFQYIGAGAQGLGLQGLQGPLPAHLIADHPVDIVLQGQHIDHGEVSPGAPVVLEATPVFIPRKPGLDLLRPGDVGLDSQGSGGAVVVLEQDMVGPCLHNAHAVGAGAHNAANPSESALHLPGLCPGGVGPHPDLILPVNPRHKAVLISGGDGRRLVIGTIASGQLDMDAPHHNTAGNGGGISIFVQR